MLWVKSRATKHNDQVSDSSGNDDSNSELFLLTTTQLQRNTGRSSLYARVTFLKNIVQNEHKIPFTTMYFLGVRGLTN
jgi:hypothetical protein